MQDGQPTVGAEQYSFFGGFEEGGLEMDGGLEVIPHSLPPPPSLQIVPDPPVGMAWELDIATQKVSCSSRAAHVASINVGWCGSSAGGGQG